MRSIVHASEDFPNPPSVDNIVAAVRRILTSVPDIQELRMHVGAPIRYEYFSDEPYAGMTVGEAARNVDLEEIHEETPRATILQVFLLAALHGLYVTQIGVGSRPLLWSWLGEDERIHGRAELFMNTPLLRDPDIPNEIMIFFAGPLSDGRLEHARTAYKVLTRSL